MERNPDSLSLPNQNKIFVNLIWYYFKRHGKRTMKFNSTKNKMHLNNRKITKLLLLLFYEFKLIRRYKGDLIDNFILTARAQHTYYYIVVIIVAGKKMQERE